MKNILLISILIAFNFTLFAQSGPGGVGNSDGTSGQPKNILWLDANYLGLNNDDNVSQWSDRSGNDNHATQGTGTRQPLFKTNVVNGFPIIYFDNDPGGGGEEDFLSYDGNILVNTDLTVFFVAARRDNGENFVLAGTTELANQNMHIGWRNATQNTCNHWNNDIYSNLSGDGSGYVGDGTPNDNYGIFMNCLGSTEVNPQRRAFQNGTEIGFINNSSQLSAYGGAAIARWRATARYYDVNVAEVIFYTKALNAAERIIVENYLAQKYSIIITNDYYNPILGYSNDIVGIGEESDGEQSESNSAGMYLSALSGLNVGDYIFTSHNNLTNNSTNFRTDAEVTAAGADEAYNRIWYIDTVETPEAQLAFDFDEALEDGENPTNISNYSLLYRSGTSGNFSKVKNADGVKNGDQVYFNLTSADLKTGYYTFATDDATNSPLKGVPGRTWYSLVSGDWDDWEIWTLDPSGALPNNPNNYTPTTSPTSNADNIVVLTGRTINVINNNMNHAEITVDGRLDIATTTGHSFEKISGTGRILMAADNFPAGDASNFYTKGQGEGTVVYYGGSYDLNTAREFFDVEVILGNAANIVTLLNDYDINGNLTITTGIVQINDATDDQIINLTVDANVLVEANAQISVGTGNTYASDAYTIGGDVLPAEYHSMYHQFNLSGNFTNRGIVRFTNQDAPIYDSLTTTGAVTVRFQGASNAEINLYNTTDFYNLVIDKGTNKTFKANLYSDNTSYFRLFGANSVGRTQGAPYSAEDPQIRKALFIHHGTLQLRGNIDIPTLSEGNDGGGNGDYSVGKNARFWMDGSNVTVYSTASSLDQITGFTSGDTYQADGVRGGGSNQAMSVFGEFKISDGTFGTRNSAGFIFWSSANAQLKIEGGTCNVAQMRSAGGSGVASYIQSGGLVIARGNETQPGGYYTDYPLFGLESSDAVFHMSGGEILLRDEDEAPDPEFYISSS
ncbi:MAG: hypothetical protein U9R54_04630, partial [Bacteroidota bacterium]|nr:hypothetical protein [Bacteroidota bacterium]